MDRMVSMTQRNFVLLLVGVCILSAGIGSGLALLAQTGPTGAKGKRGPEGKRGPRGPQGPEGKSATAEVEGLEAEVEELRGRVEEGEELRLPGRSAGRIAQRPRRRRRSSFLCEEFGIGC